MKQRCSPLVVLVLIAASLLAGLIPPALSHAIMQTRLLASNDVSNTVSIQPQFAFKRAYSSDLLYSAHQSVLLRSGKLLLFTSTVAQIYDPTNGTWITTGSMLTPRSMPTITMLSDGRVLVIGGDGQTPTSAEVYDPAMGTWSPTGSLTRFRSSYAATLLENGKVLVSGGVGTDGGSLDSAELYDPTTGTWSATGSMDIAHYGHTGTLLPDGKVLVAGGYKSELYDPTTGAWSVTGTMFTPRRLHKAVLLENGKLLVIGGETISYDDPLASTELYDQRLALGAQLAV